MEGGCCHAVNLIINNVKLSVSESCRAIVTVVFILGRHFRQLEDVVWSMCSQEERPKPEEAMERHWRKCPDIWPSSDLHPSECYGRIDDLHVQKTREERNKKPWDQASCLNQAEVSEDFQPLTLTFRSFYRFFRCCETLHLNSQHRHASSTTFWGGSPSCLAH